MLRVFLSTQRIIPFRFTDNAYCYTHITNCTISAFFEHHASLFFRSNGQNLHFLRNVPARHTINRPFECPIWHSWVFVFLVRRTWLYSFKNIEKHHHHSPLYTTCANRAQSGKSGILKNRTIIGLNPTSHVSSCPRGPTDKKISHTYRSPLPSSLTAKHTCPHFLRHVPTLPPAAYIQNRAAAMEHLIPQLPPWQAFISRTAAC